MMPLLFIAALTRAAAVEAHQDGPQLPAWVLIIVCLLVVAAMVSAAFLLVSGMINARKKNWPGKSSPS